MIGSVPPGSTNLGLRAPGERLSLDSRPDAPGVAARRLVPPRSSWAPGTRPDACLAVCHVRRVGNSNIPFYIGYLTMLILFYTGYLTMSSILSFTPF